PLPAGIGDGPGGGGSPAPQRGLRHRRLHRGRPARRRERGGRRCRAGRGRDMPTQGRRREGRTDLPPRRRRGLAVPRRELRRRVLLLDARARRERARHRARAAPGLLSTLRHRAPHRAPGPQVTGPAVALRMDDVGAASKRNEVYGITRLELGGLRVPFPGNLLFFKYLPPIKRWGPYRELGGRDWEAVLDWLERHD